MSAMTSQITGISIVCLTVCSGADQRKHQSSASLTFVRRIHDVPGTGGLPSQRASKTENVFMSLRHHKIFIRVVVFYVNIKKIQSSMIVYLAHSAWGTTPYICGFLEWSRIENYSLNISWDIPLKLTRDIAAISEWIIKNVILSQSSTSWLSN